MLASFVKCVISLISIRKVLALILMTDHRRTEKQLLSRVIYKRMFILILPGDFTIKVCDVA